MVEAPLGTKDLAAREGDAGAATGGRSALLLGRAHHRLGALAAEAEGPAAIALSRGGAPKTYPHTEPNEDAALFALGEAGWLAAVADGHHGAAGAQAVLEHIERHWAPRWLGKEPVLASSGDAWQEIALNALLACNRAVLKRAGRDGAPPAPTTLSLALVRPQEKRCAWLCMGDSHLFRVGDPDLEELGWASLERKRTYFLGYDMSRESATQGRPPYLAGSTPLAGIEALVLATDGLSETGIGVENPARAVAEAVAEARRAQSELRPLEACKRLARVALAAHRHQHAGDNLACAVLWTDGCGERGDASETPAGSEAHQQRRDPLADRG